MKGEQAEDHVRVLVLDDGETWETLDANSNALVVDVTPAEAQRLADGKPIDEVLCDRTGTRVAWLAESPRPRGVLVEFFDAPADVVQREGPFDWIHIEGRALVGVVGEEHTEIATLDPGTWTWRDRRGNCWVDVSVQDAASPRATASCRGER